MTASPTFIEEINEHIEPRIWTLLEMLSPDEVRSMEAKVAELQNRPPSDGPLVILATNVRDYLIGC